MQHGVRNILFTCARSNITRMFYKKFLLNNQNVWSHYEQYYHESDVKQLYYIKLCNLDYKAICKVGLLLSDTHKNSTSI